MTQFLGTGTAEALPWIVLGEWYVDSNDGPLWLQWKNDYHLITVGQCSNVVGWVN